MRWVLVLRCKFVCHELFDCRDRHSSCPSDGDRSESAAPNECVQGRPADAQALASLGNGEQLVWVFVSGHEPMGLATDGVSDVDMRWDYLG